MHNYTRFVEPKEESEAMLEEQKRVLFKDQICTRCKKAIPAKMEHFYIWGKLHDTAIAWRLHPDCYDAYKNVIIEQEQPFQH